MRDGFRVAVLCVAGLLAGCASPGGFGATVGGSQDINLARMKIDAGIVPNPEDIAPEGVYAEQDMPLVGPACDQVLCVRAEQGIADNVELQRPEVFIHLGLASSIDPATFHRRPQNLAVVIDHSGSMEEAGKLDAVKDAALRLIDQLDAGDQLTLIQFSTSADHLIGPEAVIDREKFKAVVRGIAIADTTCIECGLRMAYQDLSAARSDMRDDRVLLFTDGLPNVGATGDGEFTTLLSDWAAQGEYLTVFGVGVDFGQALVTRIAAVRGANYVFLPGAERTRTVFDEELDFLLTPIAYELALQIEPAAGLKLEAVYGIPGVEPGAATASSTVATVFLSKRKGAIVARISGTPNPGDSLATTSLSYKMPDGSVVSGSLLSRFEGSAVPWYSSPGVRKAVALTNFAIGARKACELYQAGDGAGAFAIADRTAQSMRAEAEATGDAGLLDLANLAEKLAALVK